MKQFRYLLLIPVLLGTIACEPEGGETPTEPGEQQLNPPQDGGDGGNGLPPEQVIDRDPDIPATLAGMEQAGRDFPAISADLVYHVEFVMAGDWSRQVGEIRYDAGDEDTPPRFYVRFDTVQLSGQAAVASPEEYAFDGRWLTVAKHNLRQMTRYEVVPEGQQVETFELGQGPFPVPFGQQVSVMTEYFDIEKCPARDDDPEDTVHLRFVPRDSHADEVSFVRLDMWVNIETFLPVQLVSVDEGEDITTAIFSNIRTDYVPEDSDFFLPRRAGWDVITERQSN
jgi:hypothetical protein